MNDNVYKLVRFVNILTDISQFFIDIYQSINKQVCGGVNETDMNRKRVKKCHYCEFVISRFR